MVKTQALGMAWMSDQSLFNEHWYRVRELTPRLAPDVQVSRHIYRLQPHYVLRRASTRRWHRMEASAYEMLLQFDGKRSVTDVWEYLLCTHDEQAPDQGELMSLLAQLHDADMLVVDTDLDTRGLLNRREKHRLNDQKMRLWNPLNIRVGLMDPDKLITRLDGVVPRNCLAPFFIGFALLLIFAGIAIAPHWQQLNDHIGNNAIFDPANILLMALIYPLMKLVHELAHALVVKRYGGDVRECGVAMLVLFPNPYVDASAVSIFANKYHRILVSAAGILTELSVAAVAVFVWLNSAGLIRDAALSVMLIGAVSTLLFNGNPLLKFDAYYMLCDWLEIPNLASRSKKYLQVHAARLVGFEPEPIRLPSDNNERAWLIGYGVLSMAYRVVLMAFIAWMMSGQYFFFGLLLAIYIVFTVLIVPLYKALQLVFRQPKAARVRVGLGAGTILMFVAGVAMAVPVAGTVTTDGIVWLPEQSVLRLEQPCEVVRVHAKPGSIVSKASPLFDCADDDWVSQVNVLRADLRRLDVQRSGLLTQDPAQHEQLNSQRTVVDAEYNLAAKRLASTRVVASVHGQFLIEGSTTLAGRYLPANTIAGYVVPENLRTIRLALTQSQAHRIASGEAKIGVFSSGGRYGDSIAHTSIQRQTPKATLNAPVVALTTLGGGKLRAAPSSSGAVLEYPVFDVELAWPATLPVQMIGSRLKVRITHDGLTVQQLLMNQWRQLFQERIAT